MRARWSGKKQEEIEFFRFVQVLGAAMTSPSAAMSLVQIWQNESRRCSDREPLLHASPFHLGVDRPQPAQHFLVCEKPLPEDYVSSLSFRPFRTKYLMSPVTRYHFPQHGAVFSQFTTRTIPRDGR